MKLDSQYEVLKAVLNHCPIDALVTVDNVQEIARFIGSSLDKAGYTIVTRDFRDPDIRDRKIWLDSHATKDQLVDLVIALENEKDEQ